jgi:hypothetical protein
MAEPKLKHKKAKVGPNTPKKRVLKVPKPKPIK